MEMRYIASPSYSTRFWLRTDAFEDLFDLAVAAIAEERIGFGDGGSDAVLEFAAQQGA